MVKIRKRSNMLERVRRGRGKEFQKIFWRGYGGGKGWCHSTVPLCDLIIATTLRSITTAMLLSLLPKLPPTKILSGCWILLPELCRLPLLLAVAWLLLPNFVSRWRRNSCLSGRLKWNIARTSSYQSTLSFRVA